MMIPTTKESDQHFRVFAARDIPDAATIVKVADRDVAPKNPNPKDSIGASKIPVHLWPATATILGSLGLLDGAAKYGRGNYRVAPVRFSIYYDAAQRHMFKLMAGEDNDLDSGLPHEAHILACFAIITDAKAAGTLIDDRDVQGGFIKLLADLTPHVARLTTLHADKQPKHFTIQDNAKQAV